MTINTGGAEQAKIEQLRERIKELEEHVEACEESIEGHVKRRKELESYLKSTKTTAQYYMRGRP